MASDKRWNGSGQAPKGRTGRGKSRYNLGPVPGKGAVRVTTAPVADGSAMHAADEIDSARPVGGPTRRGGADFK